MRMSQWPAAARPREKLLNQGPSALSDVELLAVLLRTGPAGLGVMGLAQTLLDAGGLAKLLSASAAELRQFKGLGPAKRAEILAVSELTRRALAQQFEKGATYTSPQAVCQYFRLRIGHLPHEVFSIMFLDQQQCLLACEELFRGTIGQTTVYPREVVLRALHWGSSGVVLAHNHPSGALRPSRADEHLTQTLKAALALVDVRVLDHVVVGPGGALSMADAGLL